jgi:uncharacterized membrane protein YccF (DUF307 family)
MSPNQPVHVSVNFTPMAVRRNPGCLMQLLYFLFIGWWLGAAAVLLAYALFALIITIPLGVALINKIPYLMALREAPQYITPYGAVQIPQHHFLVRAIWFLAVGWWATALLLSAGYLLCLTIIGMPIGFWLFDATPGALTLRRSS